MGHSVVHFVQQVQRCTEVSVNIVRIFVQHDLISFESHVDSMDGADRFKKFKVVFKTNNMKKHELDKTLDHLTQTRQ